jgi:DNA topoisomerase-2
MPPKKTNNTKSVSKLATSKYVKKDPISHILDRSDTWIGSTKIRDVEEYVVDEGVDDDGDNTEGINSISKKTIKISPGIIRMFVEPLSNVIDNVARSNTANNPTTEIRINIDEDTGEVSFWNDGEVIPITLHEEEKCYNHTLIFGHLMTSSNYDDTEDRENISGLNGIGIKAVSVYSKDFTVEGLDPVNRKTFKQTWTNNMRDASEPEVDDIKGKNKLGSKDPIRGYTKVTYNLEFERFGLKNFTPEIISYFKRLIIDTAMITKVPVFYNDKRIPVNSLVEYSKLYIHSDISFTETKKSRSVSTAPDETERTSSKEKEQLLYIKTPSCEVVITPSDNEEFRAVSFANGIFTPNGGTHVDAWSEAIFRPIVDKLNKPKKPQVNIADVKRFFNLFVVAIVKQPRFDSQSKFKLEAPEVEAQVKKTHVSAMLKWPVMEDIQNIITAKEMIVLKKTERKKRGHEKIEGLDPANNEGTNKSRECTLIVVEGLSAKTYAVQGIENEIFGKKGRDWFGIYPLRGKILNTRNAKPIAITKNKVVTDVIKALGLKYGTDYTDEENFKTLRYGRLMILTDADEDGFHISGLIQNVIHSLFPTLLEREEKFITSMQTPIVRVYEGKKERIFYDLREFQTYVNEVNTKFPNKKIKMKYYKGLGSSNEEEVYETAGQKLIEFSSDEKTKPAMDKVFNDKFTNQRKEWLAKYDKDKVILQWDGDKKEVVNLSISDFIDTEFIKFGMADNIRSIPSLIDSLKEGHRKILFVAFLRNLKYNGKVLKVAQFSGSVAEKSAYHHGEQNLYSTIVGMAQSFVGSNNIPLFFRDGAFGTRLAGGDDSASARYIHTKLEELTRLIFRPEDDNILSYKEEDGEQIEPEHYVPIIPMILVNGSKGVGTGWSTDIPCYNPKDIISCIKIWLENGNKAFDTIGEYSGAEVVEQKASFATSNSTRVSLFPELKPWYRGFKGEIVKEDENKFISKGVMTEEKTKGATTKIKVTELPVGFWTNDFTNYLEKLKEDKSISNYKNYSTAKNVDYIITEHKEGIACNMKNLKLNKSISTTNMVLFSPEGNLKRYSTVDDIIDEFCKVRYTYYEKRKENMLKQLENELKFLGNKKRFLEEVRDGGIVLFKMLNGKRQSRKKEELVKDLESKKYDKIFKEKKKGIKAEEDPEEENEDETKLESKTNGYDYLLSLQIGSMTQEKIEKLKDDIANKIDEKEKLEKTLEKDLWLSDLDEFESAYDKWLVKMAKEVVKVKKVKKN